MSTIIGIKELQRGLKKVADAAQRGETFTFVRDSKPVFRIEPIPSGSKKNKTIGDLLEAASFSHSDRRLSQKIDEVVYGSRG